MEKKDNIYIINENIGKGHRAVSEALKEEIENKFKVSVEVIDYFSLVSENIEKALGSTYKYIIGNLPYLYKIIYYILINKEGSDYSIMDMLIAQKLKSRIGEEKLQNSILISTFPNSTIALSFIDAYKKYAVVTDYYAHDGWITKKIDGYFVANNEIKEKFEKADIDKNKIHITGIPIKKKFYKTTNKSEVKKRLSINNDKKVILLMGGGDGIIPDAEYIISNLSQKYNIIVITAKNKKLKENLEEKNFPNTIILGYEENIEDIMGISDIAITKAGGLSLSELNLKRVPIIIYKAIPGQEKDNSIFFQKNNACIEINNKEKLKITVNKILSGKIELRGKIVDSKIPSTSKIIKFIEKDL
jgi:processive 1,2-diacylglycerol beta-glucosyltransferase